MLKNQQKRVQIVLKNQKKSDHLFASRGNHVPNLTNPGEKLTYGNNFEMDIFFDENLEKNVPEELILPIF